MSSQNYLLRICRPDCFSVISRNGVMNVLAALTEPRSIHSKTSFNRKSLLKNEHSERKEGVKKKVRYSHSAETDLEEEWKLKKDKAIKAKRTELQTFPRLLDKSPLSKEDHTDSELVKHIEVLQRFAERYNAVQDGKTKQKIEEDKRKKKHLDNLQKSSFSTFVRRPINKANKPYLSLAQEILPGMKKKKLPSVKPTVPKIKFDVNPDSIQRAVKAPKKSMIKLYALQNTFVRNQYTQSRQEKSKQGKRAEDATIGDYYYDKYPHVHHPKVDKAKKSGTLSRGLRDGLLERRKSELKPKIEVPKPTIYSKTSSAVKPTHLPLDLCSKMKSHKKDEKKQDTTSPINKQSTNNPPTTSSSKRDRDPVTKNNMNSILHKLIKYFK